MHIRRLLAGPALGKVALVTLTACFAGPWLRALRVRCLGVNFDEFLGSFSVVWIEHTNIWKHDRDGDLGRHGNCIPISEQCRNACRV